MHQTYRTEFRRKYLIESLPEPLTRASRHLQIFDNYIAETRLRIRSVRDPETRTWLWTLEQRLPHTSPGGTRSAEIHLNEAEHTVFEIFEGTEIRKNRYFHEFDHKPFTFDVYLGPLWGLNIANADFVDEDSFVKFEPPAFAVFEVTRDQFFVGENLVLKKFEDVQTEVAKFSNQAVWSEVPDE